MDSEAEQESSNASFYKSDIELSADESDTQDQDIDSDNEDPTGLESAAFQARLPFSELSVDEQNYFPDIRTGSAGGRRAFLYIRNRILQLWLENPLKQLLLTECQQKLEQPYNCELELCKRILLYLERQGLVNFGQFEVIGQPLTWLGGSSEPSSQPPLRVIVIGAGISGLIAAKQFQYFGCEVTVLEARDRLGGRIATLRKGNNIGDLGATVITGLGGNPLTICSKQINMELFKIKVKCPLFDDTGKPISAERDANIEREFNRLLDASAYLSHEKQIEEVTNKEGNMSGHAMSLGRAVDILIQLQEQKCRENQLAHLRKIIALQANLSKTLAEMEVVKNESAILHEAWLKEKPDNSMSTCEMLTGGPESVMALFDQRSKQRDLAQALGEFKRLKSHGEEIWDQIEALETAPPPGYYLSAADLHILNWHKANIEFANAAVLEDLSLKHWDQDDENEFTGPHLTVRNGYSCLPVALSEGITDIRMGTVVEKITYSDTEAKVVAKNGSETIELTADVVLCTLPLGVLKAHHTTMFEPPLPKWKTNSIENLGFGVLNKVFLAFDNFFWDVNLNLFGYVPATITGRGEFYLFWSVSKTPVLIALVSGASAVALEETSDSVVIDRVMVVLRKIFHMTSVPAPKHAEVTKWGKDPYAKGSYSYVAVGASGNDYDVLASPVTATSGGQPRLFFAGEHTIRQYPATVHGAFLSGLREVGRVCDTFTNSGMSSLDTSFDLLQTDLKENSVPEDQPIVIS